MLHKLKRVQRLRNRNGTLFQMQQSILRCKNSWDLKLQLVFETYGQKYLCIGEERNPRLNRNIWIKYRLSEHLLSDVSEFVSPR